MKPFLFLILAFIFSSCTNYSIEKYSDFYLVKKSKFYSRDEYLFYSKNTGFAMWGNYIFFNSKEWGTKFKTYGEADSSLSLTLQREAQSDLLRDSEPTEIIDK